MPLTSSVMRIKFRMRIKFQVVQQMLRKNVKSLLEQLQVCIFAEIVFGVRCTLRTYTKYDEKGEKLNWKDAVA